MDSLKVNYLVGWALVLATLAMACFYVPLSEKVLGTNYLIFFYHFPSAFGCLILFGLAAVHSLLYLWKGSPRQDHLALGTIEAGVLACTICLVTGSIWAKAAWGVWWVWEDRRLMAVAIMWFTYLGYLALRSAIESPAQRARYGAIFALLAAVNIPIVWFANQWTVVSHPQPQAFKPESTMRVTMWFGALAFLILYIAFLRTRARVARLQEESQVIEEILVQRGM